ncbi:MAG: pyrroloquinoline quinone-dependent dehydrogenase [Gemmatimonadota bacterium]
MSRRMIVASAFALTCTLGLAAQQPAARDWPNYGRDPGGSRFSPLAQITGHNVAQLEIAWTYHTGEADIRGKRGGDRPFETTPLVVDGTMYLTTPLGKVIALDPATGAERWKFDGKVDASSGFGDFTNRGASTWLDPNARAGSPCRRRIFIATIDARLIALDAADDRRGAGFGIEGTIDLRAGLRIPPFERAAYEVTSAPAVVGGLVITGSAIADNSRPAPASGEVRAFDARTGKLRWTWDPIPQHPPDPAAATWRNGSAARTGAANVWSTIAADAERDLVFLPTSSAAPDYFGGLRPGENRYANSIVALQASTGRLVWHFQTVHHDLWDYDNASPPALVTIMRDGRRIPAVLQATKTGMLFVLNRENGQPVFPVEERPVPKSDLPDDEAWPTQPFTTAIEPLSPHRFNIEDVWGATPEDRAACREMVQGLRNEGIFTPPSLSGTLAIPSNIGGAHWGGLAADEARAIAVVPVNRVAAVVQLIKNEAFNIGEARQANGRLDYQYTYMEGTPYVMRRRVLLSPSGLPCTPPPFGALVAIDLNTGARRWEVPLGTLSGPDGKPMSHSWGSPNLGGPIITAGGLVFIAATLDRAIRGFDLETGRELWRAPLPAGGRATPMTYEAGGRQFVVVAAGGSGKFGDGDALVAFAIGGKAVKR